MVLESLVSLKFCISKYFCKLFIIIAGIGTEFCFTALNLEDDLENLWSCLNVCLKKIKENIAISDEFHPNGTKLKIKIDYDGNENDPKTVDFVIKKDIISSPTLLECKDEDEFQVLLLSISQCFCFAITNNNKVKCTFLNEVMRELSSHVSNFDKMKIELEKTGEFHELVKIGDTHSLSSFKSFLFNHSRHILLYAQMLSDRNDDLINYSKNQTTKQVTPINCIVDKVLKNPIFY